ncbi:peptide chain release factor-like protein [Mycoplasma sp. SG1]|uniref:peptide chain release factor-like protein n=1 Tax=Mycoplasma sp. SG1 TaxID=2810348 RepID=UPI002AFE2D98|nr:peptide chain release factor-like protein [Mycoplasma sp. SG1]
MSDEIDILKNQQAETLKEIIQFIQEENQLDAHLQNKNIILEMRAATGGEEAAIFVKDLFSAYLKFIESFKWKYQILELSESSTGAGYSFVSIEVKGVNVYQYFQFESGVHRVQRVPKTEVKGRVHTSTISVAVLPTVDDIEVKIDPKDLKIDTYRASGAGGQHVNMTDSAVRITHLPTNIVVTSQNERSQHENKNLAMKALRAKLYKHNFDIQVDKIMSQRNQQIGRGMRAEKIRTYNYPQNRVTDHRCGKSWSNLEDIMNGNFNDIVSSLRIYKNELYTI